MFLKVWGFFFLFSQTSMLLFNKWHFGFSLFFIQSMRKVLKFMIDHFKRLGIEGHKDKLFINLRINLFHLRNEFIIIFIDLFAMRPGLLCFIKPSNVKLLIIRIEE